MKSIYKFFGFRNFDLDALAGSYLWFSKVTDFNDPFEGLYLEQIKFRTPDNISNDEALILFRDMKLKGIGTDKGAPNQAAIKYAIHTSDETRLEDKKLLCKSIEESVSKTLNYVREKLYCCCFIQDFDQALAIKNKLMWSHYADGLRGYSIEFDMEALTDHLYKNISLDLQGGDVVYKSLGDVDSIDLIRSTKQGDSSGVDKILLSKSSDWDYEQEYRIIAPCNKVNYTPSCIKTITLGSKMTNEKRTTLMAVIRSLGLEDKVKVAVIDKTTFNLKIVEYSEGAFE
jgi:hypothetical protein